MSKSCGHTKVQKLEIGYGYGAASGWSGIGATYRCPRCAECLWFDDDVNSCFPKEMIHNDKKRKENLKWRPKGKIGPHRNKRYSKRQMNREIRAWINSSAENQDSKQLLDLK